MLYLFSCTLKRPNIFFSLDIQSRIEKKSAREIVIKPGEEVFYHVIDETGYPSFTIPVMKVLSIPSISNRVFSVEQGAPLVGVCALEKLPLIQKVINAGEGGVGTICK